VRLRPLGHPSILPPRLRAAETRSVSFRAANARAMGRTVVGRAVFANHPRSTGADRRMGVKSMTRWLAAALMAGCLTLSDGVYAQAPSSAPNTGASPPAETSAKPPAETPAKPPAATLETAHVEGFRSAKWGMGEDEVKAAITLDFKIPADKLKADQNVNERTSLLTIQVPDLIEGAGIARVSYILGYTTKKLIQVNIVWGTPVDPQAKPEGIAAAANQLRDLFMSAGYDPASVVSNARASDGEVIVFEGQDTDKHTTLLRFLSVQPPEKDQKDSKDAKKSASVTALFLSYILDSKTPDIFRLKKGQF
jgi:hypothetical protein